MRELRYVGVSGVGSSEQQAQLAESFATQGLKELGRHMLIGVKATTRTQVDERFTGYKDDWYPVGDSLKTVLSPAASVNVLQLYADDWTNLKERALPLMERSLERSEAWVDGLQFDMLPWFSEETSLQLVERYADAVTGPVILQCYGALMREQTPGTVIERLKRVQGYVSHVLFDASEGRGRLMDPDSLCVWVDALESSSLPIAPVIAGGLSAESVCTLLPAIIRRFDDISWDAEGQLHTNNVLDLVKTEEYLQASAEILKK